MQPKGVREFDEPREEIQNTKFPLVVDWVLRAAILLTPEGVVGNPVGVRPPFSPMAHGMPGDEDKPETRKNRKPFNGTGCLMNK
jgi:hypothetical protein